MYGTGRKPLSSRGNVICIVILIPLVLGVCALGSADGVGLVDWHKIVIENKGAREYDLDSHLKLAVAYANLGMVPEATKEFRLLAKANYEEFGQRIITENEARLADNPKDVLALNFLAFTYYAFEKYDKALANFRALAEIDLRNVWIRHYVAFALARVDKLDEAISVLREALKLDPNNEYTHLLLGLAYKEKKWYGLAWLEFLKAPHAVREAITLR